MTSGATSVGVVAIVPLFTKKGLGEIFSPHPTSYLLKGKTYNSRLDPFYFFYSSLNNLTEEPPLFKLKMSLPRSPKL